MFDQIPGHYGLSKLIHKINYQIIFLFEFYIKKYLQITTDLSTSMSKHGDGSVLMWKFTSNVSDKSG